MITVLCVLIAVVRLKKFDKLPISSLLLLTTITITAIPISIRMVLLYLLADWETSGLLFCSAGALVFSVLISSMKERLVWEFFISALVVSVVLVGFLIVLRMFSSPILTMYNIRRGYWQFSQYPLFLLFTFFRNF